jgi:hypothetical protein
MAEYGEWGRKGAVLSEVTAAKEYGVTRELIVKGIQAGKLEFREGSVHGNPYLRLLRRQLEAFVASEHGPEFLQSKKTKTELWAINKEITLLKNKLTELEERKSVLESRSHSK